MTLREGDQIRLDAWYGTSTGAYKWDGNNAFCEFYNVTANSKKRVGPIGLGGLNTRATTLLHGIVKSTEGSGWASLTGWEPTLIMTHTAGLRANGQTVTPAAVSVGWKSVIFSDESDTLFGAVTQRFDNKYHFVWNWYD
jgi:hypothetical protein